MSKMRMGNRESWPEVGCEIGGVRIIGVVVGGMKVRVEKCRVATKSQRNPKGKFNGLLENSHEMELNGVWRWITKEDK